jgi:regulator of RNase E activity RraA
MLPNRNELIARFQRISSPTAYDVLLKMGYPNQAVHSDIRPLVHGRRIAGPARTIRGESLAEDEGKWGTAFSYDFFRQIETGDVIVFDCGGHVHGGPWGGNTASTARVRGAQGIVIDGGTRDYSDIIEIGFPTFCRFVTPVLAHGRFQITGINESIQLTAQIKGRVTVNPGDFVLADDDGIVVIPAEHLQQVLEFAEYAERAEKEIRAAIESGEDREAIDNRIDRWALLKERLGK